MVRVPAGDNAVRLGRGWGRQSTMMLFIMSLPWECIDNGFNIHAPPHSVLLAGVSLHVPSISIKGVTHTIVIKNAENILLCTPVKLLTCIHAYIHTYQRYYNNIMHTCTPTIILTVLDCNAMIIAIILYTLEQARPSVPVLVFALSPHHAACAVISLCYRCQCLVELLTK